MLEVGFTAFAILLIKASVVIGLAWGVNRVLKRRTANLRQAIWVLAIGSLLLLPVLSSLLPAWHSFEIESVQKETRQSTNKPKPDATQPISVAPPEAKQLVDVSTPIADDPAGKTRLGLMGSLTLEDVVLFFWFMGTVLLAGWIGLDIWRLRFLLRRTVALGTAEPNEMVQQIRQKLGIRRTVRLHVSNEVDTPMTWGLFKPVIVVPAYARLWSSDQWYAVLYHEMGHISRLDYAWYMLGRCVCAVYWFNPLVWVANKYHEREQEKACDELVLRGGIPAFAYAGYLVQVARNRNQLKRTPHSSLAMAGEPQLKKRIRLILNDAAVHGALSKTRRTLMTLVACVLLIPVAALSPELTVRESTFIWLEAEDSMLYGAMQVTPDEDASGEAYVWTPSTDTDVSEQGEMTFRFYVPQKAQYIVWGRIIAPSGRANSFFVSVDRSAFEIWDIFGPDDDHRAQTWAWTKVTSRTEHGDHELQVHTLEAGWHSLTMKQREQGTRIDKILITNNQSYRPRDKGYAPKPETPAYIWMEAEEGMLSGSMQQAVDQGASNGAYVWLSAGHSATRKPEGGKGVYTFEITEPGDYVIWGRVIAPAHNANSFFVALDGNEPFIWDTEGPDPKNMAHSWSWDVVHARPDSDAALGVPMAYRLEAGSHRIVIKGREKGTRLDRLLVTNDLSFKPEGWGTSPDDIDPIYYWVEAEAGLLTKPLIIEQDSSASMGQYITVSPGVKSTNHPPEDGRVRYHLTVPETGTYLIWSRVLAPESGDSFWVRVDNGRWIRWNGIQHGATWHWEEIHDADHRNRVVSFDLKAGAHTLDVAYRESKTKLDGFLLTNDLNYVPSLGQQESVVLKRELLVSALR